MASSFITTLTGKENIYSNLAEFYVFFSPTKKDIEKGFHNTEININQLFQYQKPMYPSPLKLINDFPAEKAAKGYIKEFGLWWRKHYEVEDGTIVKIYANRQNGIAANRKMACCYLKTDSRASLVRLSFGLTNTNVSNFKEAFIEGRFSYVTLKQLEKEGVLINPMYMNMLSEDNQKKIFKWEVLQKAIKEDMSVSYSDDLIVKQDSVNIDI